jgi:hypothetical protein
MLHSAEGLKKIFDDSRCRLLKKAAVNRSAMVIRRVVRCAMRHSTHRAINNANKIYDYLANPGGQITSHISLEGFGEQKLHRRW